MFLRLLFESFRRGRRAKLLALAAVSLGTLAATALGVLLLTSGDQLSRAMTTYGANLRVLPADGAETLPASELQGLEESFWRNNLTAVAPLLEVRVRWSAVEEGGATGSHPTRSAAGTGTAGGTGSSPAAEGTPAGRVAPAVGTWFDHELAHWRTGLPATRPSLPVEGRWPGEPDGSAGDGGSRAASGDSAPGHGAGTAAGDRSSGDDSAQVAAVADADALPEVALGRRLAASLGVSPGDAVALELGQRRARARVVGVVSGGGEEEDAGFAPLALVQELAGRPGQIGAAEISALTVPEPSFQRRDPEAMSPEEYDAWYCTAYPSAVALSVDEVLPSGRAEVVRQVAGTAGAVLLRLRAVLGVLAGVALLGAFLGVASSMAATVQGRRGELALLSALGSDRAWIVRFFLAEAALLGLGGGLLGGLGGLAAGRLLAAALFELPAQWHLILLPFAAVLGLGVAVAGTLRPLWSVLGDSPARALAGSVGRTGTGSLEGRTA